jgi:PDZ domain
MKRNLLLFFIIISFSTSWAQDGFVFDKGVDKVTISFELIDNLIFIPMKVNGIDLNLLLDTGVDETVLFSLDDKKEVTFFNVEKVQLRGLGSNDAIEGLKSTNNLVTVPGLQSKNHLLYVVLDQEFNISSRVGIPVNGIIGFDFFKNHLVEINYNRKKVIVYKDIPKYRSKIEKKHTQIPIKIENSKPYIETVILQNGVEIPSKLLIDTGSSDSLWIFGNAAVKVKLPAKNFEDYLGKGLSGDILGRRASVEMIKIKDFQFKNIVAAFPDSTFVNSYKLVLGRMGSVGGEIMRRFNTVFDYTNGAIFLKKNNQYSEPFSYNKSGIEMQHHGLQWVEEIVKVDNIARSDDTGNMKLVSNDFKYKFVLKPIFEIYSLRKNSPAMNCGLQIGDIIVTINGIEGYQYTLKKINDLLKSDDNEWITIEVERNNKIMKFKFQLVNEL